MPISARPKTLVSIIFVAAAALSLTASPAWASEKPALDYCWQNLDDGVTQCFVDEDTMDAAIQSQTRSVLAAPGVLARASSASVVTYVLGTFWENANYGGAFMKATSANSATCNGGGQMNVAFVPAWMDRISSFKAWYGCLGTLFQNTGQAGASFGAYTSAGTVGALNDQASSARLT